MSRPLDAAEELRKLTEQGLLRSLHARGAAGGKFRQGGRTILNFSSNDYLNLARDGRVKAAAIAAVEQLGCGAAASRLMSGHLEMHERLERRLAEWVGTEAALVFGSGFLTNLGVLTALAARGDAILADRLNHASLVDGARLSGARLARYRHGDADHLAKLLEARPAGRRIVATDSVFSMDGDVAPLGEISRLAERHAATLVVDEAHALGVFGRGGGGVCRDSPGVRPDVIVGTLSKALGGYGGFAACSAAMRELLVNRARSFIYSTALPPACLGSALAALDVVAGSGELGRTLLERAAGFRTLLSDAGLNVGRSCCQIVPVLVGDNDTAVALARRLEEDGILTVAVRPPTVPPGTARLRMSITLAHDEADLQLAAEKLIAAARYLGIS
jgi:8-amino-7-oxononanoate synthase